MKIWELTECENNYDCTPCVIHRWNKKPSMEMLAKAVGRVFPASTDESTLATVKLWQDGCVRFSPYGSYWELNEVDVEEI
jgi:hypothetical protein